jgi:glutathione synthase/RimK-type ligase-like ATP-grasp enzyme
LIIAKNFINPEVKIRIGIVQTYEPGERWGYPLGAALEEMGADWIPIEARYLKAVIEGHGAADLLIEGDPDIKEQRVEDLAVDCMVWRVSEADFYTYLNIFVLLSRKYTMVNDWQCIWTCSDKWRTSALLAAAGIAVVPTILLTRDMAVPRFSSNKTIIKPSVGASGNDIRVAMPGNVLENVLPYVAQPLVSGPSRAHIRVIVCGSEPVASIHRIPGPNHRGTEVEVNNVAAGGTPVPAPMEPVRELAVQVARCVDGDVIGIDFVPWDDGFAVLEVNSSPGFNGILEAVGVDCFHFAAQQVLTRVKRAHDQQADPNRISNVGAAPAAEQYLTPAKATF